MLIDIKGLRNESVVSIEGKVYEGKNAFKIYSLKNTAEGIAHYFQAEDLLIKDDKGEILKIKDYDIKKNKQNPNEFTKEFEGLKANKKYYIYTNDFSNVEVREDLKFKIELKK